MSGNVPALEAGFSYQELYGWYRVLDLLSPSGKVQIVSIEDPAGEHFDDVTLRPVPTTSHSPEFIQVKFHDSLADAYSSSSLMTESHGLLLQKAWRTWKKLRDEFETIELRLVTTWGWNHRDPIAPHIHDHRLSRQFVEGDVVDKAAEVRRKWWEYLERPDDLDLRAFLRSLRLRTGYAATSELTDLVNERMRLYGLKDTDEAAHKGQDRVRRWIIERQVTITRADLEAAIDELDLRGEPAEPSVTLYVHTVLKDPLETGAQYELDWRHYFEGPDHEKGHRLRNPDDWNRALLPQLYERHSQMRDDSPCRFVRLRGAARLAPWFAVGYVFRETGGWTLETDQYGSRWRTDAAPATDLDITVEAAERTGPADVVAIGISVSGDIAPDVRANLERMGDPAGRLLFVTMANLGREAVRSDADLVALARLVKSELQGLRPRARRLLVFYWGPASGAVFIGHQLNAVAPVMQLFEEEFGEYSAAFTLGS